MQESLNKNFNHLKIHTQYSICEGAVKIEELKDFCKNNIIQSVGLSDTVNLCGALDFSVNISKSGSQPIIGTQIFFKFNDVLGLVPLIALNKNGYKRIIELSSKSYLENDNLSSPHCNFEDLLIEHEGISVFSGSVNGLIGKLFNKGRLNEIDEIYKKSPVIIKFYRGHWCPYCIIELKEYESKIEEIKRYGSLVVLVPDTKVEILKTKKKHELSFNIYQEKNNKIQKI